MLKGLCLKVQGWQRLPPTQRGIVIIALPVCCLLSTVGVLIWLSASIADYEGWVRHTQRVQLEGRELLNHLIDAETGVRGYHLTRQVGFLEPYYTAAAQLPLTLENLEVLISDNPHQLEHFRHFKSLVEETFHLLAQQLEDAPNLSLAETEQRLYFYRQLEQAKQAMDRSRVAINAFMSEEDRLLADRQQHLEALRQINTVVLLLAVVVGLGSSGLAIHWFCQLYQEVDLRGQRLEAACDRLARFTANASHELRAPIAAILSHAQVGLLLARQAPEQSLPRLEKVATLAKAMGQLVNDLLFLARYEGVSPPDFATSFDLVPFIEQVVQEWQETGTASHHFYLEVPSVPMFIQGDREMLKQVILNLLTNADRYTPKGGTITLRLEPQGSSAVIHVSDTGMGISEAALPHIFDYFYRDERVRQQGISGSGLGLAIVRQIVHLHRGSITVHSQENQGSTFTVRLPLAP
ncbi:CHASE3 domain-containing protein [Thermosynechococcus sp. QS41]|uniref:sensor histidine kinase n=1 Tax=Thermosynechococcus sp. QS41 TaxID=3074101 RepID=UPI002877EC05|nr:ATP-binding protein [Thermosynechococcus sp. QS41]WNC61319.1 CHASE3 domain-containing protein [Thermosynechococcus sp. QS41]